MKRETLTSLTVDYDPKLKRSIKVIYKLVNDVCVFCWDDVEMTVEEFEHYKELAVKKMNGEDITFEIGYRYFRDNKIMLEKGVFVPQYDTEQIIDFVHRNNITEGKALEIGTGSGAISISLAQETKMEVTAIDINPKAIDLAKRNDHMNKVNFLEQDFNKFNPEHRFDLIISNPPYIDVEDEDVEEWVRDNQPHEALFAEDNGLAFYRMIFERAQDLLNDGGHIILEIGHSQAEDVAALALELLSKSVEVKKDYTGLDRFVVVHCEK